MARQNAYICDGCGKNINDDAPHDFVFYMVAGNVNQREVDITELDIPDHLKLLLAQRTPRLELCVACVTGEVSLGDTVKGKMLGQLTADARRSARARQGGPVDPDAPDATERNAARDAAANAAADEVSARFPGITPIEPA